MITNNFKYVQKTIYLLSLINNDLVYVFHYFMPIEFTHNVTNNC